MNRDSAVLLALGAVVAGVSQRFVATGWWLNSGGGVATTMTVLVALGVIVGYALPRVAGDSPVGRIVLLWAGVMTGMTVTLFAIGPGNIFPIVLVFAAVMSAIAIAAGSAAGLGLRWLTRPAPRT